MQDSFGEQDRKSFLRWAISRAVAFEGLLNNGEVFARRLMNAYSNGRDWPESAHIATDGESYGHHHRYGEMALSYALHHIEENEFAKLTNYGEYLERYPPTHEATSTRTPRGVAHMVSGGGKRTAAAIPVATEVGTRSGGRRFGEALDWLRDEIASEV